MKATEIRVGNYVQNQDGRLKGYPVGKPFKLELKDFVWLEFYVPVRVTEEHLLKLGFEKKQVRDGFYYEITLKDNVPFRIWRSFLNEKFSFSTGGYDAEDNDFMIEIKYIHRLQNLFFALTEKELEIKNDE